MKFSASVLLFSACSTWDAVYGSNFQGCLDSATVDPGRDYFPDKVSPKFAKLFSVTYHNTYKIVKNLDSETTYVLYQCGTEPPSGIEANLTLSVPLQQGVGLTTTTSLPHFELLGLRDEVKAYLGDPQWITSPCMNERIQSGDTINVPYPNDEGAIDNLLAQTSSDIVIFGNLIKGTIASPNFVAINAFKERNNHGIGTFTVFDCITDMRRFHSLIQLVLSLLFVGEWHKFFSLFFNKEKEANEQFETMHSRYECTSKNAQHILADKPRPKVVFAEFSTFCGGWSVGSCPNFYCDFIEDCSADILVDDMSGSVINPACGLDRPYMTTAEFVAFAKDADVWVYPGHGDYYWDIAYEDFGDQLDAMKSVQNRQVYDTVLTALNTWYEHRIVEYGKF